MTRKQIIEQIEQAVCKDRQQTHGKPEKSFKAIALLWDAYLTAKANDCGHSISISDEDVACMLALFKIGRAIHNPQHTDNWTDAAGYMICGGEIASEKDRIKDSDSGSQPKSPFDDHGRFATLQESQIDLHKAKALAEACISLYCKNNAVLTETEFYLLDKARNSPLALNEHEYYQVVLISKRFQIK